MSPFVGHRLSLEHLAESVNQEYRDMLLDVPVDVCSERTLGAR
jgi:hypothetical protein